MERLFGTRPASSQREAKDLRRGLGITRMAGDQYRFEFRGDAESFQDTEKTRVEVGDHRELQAAALERSERLFRLGKQTPRVSAREVSEQIREIFVEPLEGAVGLEYAGDQRLPPVALQLLNPVIFRTGERERRRVAEAGAKARRYFRRRHVHAVAPGDERVAFADRPHRPHERARGVEKYGFDGHLRY